MATSKNKPKRLDRNKSWRVARRKKKQNDRVHGISRSRGKRPKNKGAVVKVVEEKKVVEKKEVLKKE